jgi:flagellar protein FliO/FliZ
MTQSFILVIIFVGLLACLPWAVNRLKQHYGLTQLGPTQQSRVLSVLAVGPHQKVVTVEVGPDHARVALVLGVTAQSVNLLHTLPVPTVASGPASASAAQIEP